VPSVLLESFRPGPFGASYRFDGLESQVTAALPGEVIPAFREVEAAVAAGRNAAGFVSYEAAAALNPELPAGEPSNGLPLLWFGIFRERIPVQADSGKEHEGNGSISPLDTSPGEKEYGRAIRSIKEYIAAGHTYQVNFTLRQRFGYSGDPFTLYRQFCRGQAAPFSAWIDTGSHCILSASPELFFALRDGVLTARPMKGTAVRRPYGPDDRAGRESLRSSAKERAENLMIVDLLRNDLSMVAETGSVAVPALFEIETYPTVHQMTSTITARLGKGAGLLDVFSSLFPCGSVTGAPKRRTMEIIRELEGGPRGLYCGAIGYVSPGPEAVFSVAIRTAVLDRAAGTGEIGVGSAVTWDSEAGAEYRECLAKSAFLQGGHLPFRLIESLLWDERGYRLLDRHLSRLAGSAGYFGFRIDETRIRELLRESSRGLQGRLKVRILLDREGGVALEPSPLQAGNGGMATAVLSGCRVDSSDPFLYHKTTSRELYDRERQQHPAFDEVIFLNERGEVTEGTYTNIVVAGNGELLTPSVRCGLLPGTLRGELLEQGIIRERVITRDDLLNAKRVWLINSVRGWRRVMIECSEEIG
jgi:para-aminobenzoate synthetase/4-amino-4-deoxychorismate lyase